MAELYLPNAADWINALEAGQRAGMTRQKTQAQATAGQRLMTGDYTGAAAAVAPYDVNLGLGIKKYGAEQEAAKRKSGYGQTLASGKPDEAVKQAQAAGDFEIAGDLQKTIDAANERQKAKLHENASRTAEIVAPLGEIQDLGERKAYIQQHKAELLASGFSEQQVDTFEPTNSNLAHIFAQSMGMKDYLERFYIKPDTKTVKNADGSESIVRLPGGMGGVGGVAARGAGPQESPQETGGLGPTPSGGIYAQVGQIASQAGAQPNEATYLQRLALVESHGDPSAQNGRSTGLFQFHPDTFAGVGGGNIHDVADQTKAALELSRRDRKNLAAIGLEPTDANVYIMHQQGAAGGRALLTAPPETNAVAALAPVYGNPDIARKAIVNNGGSEDMTAGQFVDMWRQKWGGAGAPQSQAQPGRAGPTAAPGVEVLYRGEAGQQEDGLTDDAVELLAGRYLKDGTLPPLGMGKAAAANRQKILNRATETAKSLGLKAEDIVAGTLSVKAAGQALNRATTQRAMVEGFENTALKNADLMLTLAPKGGGQTNMPVVNRWLQAGRKQIAGDPDVSNFEIALGTFADEYAKIVSGATGAQGSTDASRKEAYDRLSKYATQGQLAGGIATMKAEMHNRITSMHDVEAGLRAQIRGGAGGSEPAATPAADAGRVIRYDAQGRRIP